MSAQKALQLSRLHPLPIGLAELIEVANCLPLELPQPPPDEPQRITGVSQLLSSGFPSSPKAVRDLWVQFSAQLPAPVRKFLGPIRANKIYLAKTQYTVLGQIRDVLRFAAQNRTKSPADAFIGLPMLTFSRIHKTGRIQFEKHPAFRVLEGVKADRIRECLVCKKIFWASRIDKKCCAPLCRGVWNTRRWREKYQDIYKLQRYQKAEQQTTREGSGEWKPKLREKLYLKGSGRPKKSKK